MNYHNESSDKNSHKDNRGVFITFEGIEGGGKSTQIALLAEHLIELGKPTIITREPGGTVIGASIRRILLDPDHTDMDFHAEVLLYAADRAQHVAELIRPGLLSGKIVISDRYVDSTIAYQYYGRNLPLDLINSANEWAVQGLKPDITFLLDLPVEAGLERATREAADRIENESIEFHKRVADGFRKLAAEDPGRWCVIDGMLTADDIHLEVLAGIAEAIKRL
ncbi:MAG: dTMP kinase [Rubrobacteridae bacterium]|nr:dTMP kinase [Rubrobacteridae bacterium]